MLHKQRHSHPRPSTNSRPVSSSFPHRKNPQQQAVVAAGHLFAAGDTLLAPGVTRRLVEEFLRRPATGEPRKVDGLAEFEKGLTAEKVNGWLGRMAEQEVQVALPRFKVTRDFKLNTVLAEMGMPTAFDPVKADFSGMNGEGEKLFITAVVHKAFVEVNEEGTEAAAATGVVVGLRSAPRHPVFRADRPFVFLIRDHATGTVWKFAISDQRVDEKDPLFFHKTTRRQFYDREMERQKALTGCDEVVFLNKKGELTEGTRTTLFVEQGGRLFTPALACGLQPCSPPMAGRTIYGP